VLTSENVVIVATAERNLWDVFRTLRPISGISSSR
jgi:hypothetical protein